jgi:hypothetical protein
VVVAVVEAAPVARDSELAAYQAQAQESLGRWRAAAQGWALAASSRPELLARAAACWVQAGEPQRALEALRAVGARQPLAGRQAVRLALALGQRGVAKELLRRLLAVRLADAQLHLMLAQLAWAAGQGGAGGAAGARGRAPGSGPRLEASGSAVCRRRSEGIGGCGCLAGMAGLFFLG